jgi:hypothetical protein
MKRRQFKFGFRHWIIIPACAVAFHSMFVLLADWDRKHGTEVLKYALPITDPIGVAMAIQRDAGGKETVQILLLYGGLQWVAIGLLLCCVIEASNRRSRRKHDEGHRCAACGYIIAPGVGNNCSECGNPLSLRRSAGM